MQTKKHSGWRLLRAPRKKKLEKVTEIYNNLETQINQLNQSNEIILGGDFNAKLELTHKTGVQTLSRNGKLLKTMIDNTRLTPTSTEADTGFWTRVNRNKPSEKSVIDYIITTPTIHKNRKMMITDESGEFRVKGKKESDHNTMILTININQPRKPQFRESWKLNNSEGWKKVYEEIKAQAERNPEVMNDYNKLENAIISTLETTTGKTKNRTDKPRKPSDENTKKRS